MNNEMENIKVMDVVMIMDHHNRISPIYGEAIVLDTSKRMVKLFSSRGFIFHMKPNRLIKFINNKISKP